MENKFTKSHFGDSLKFLVLACFLLIGALNLSAQVLTASAGANKTICAGSSTAIGGSPTASGGTTPYTYSWTPSIGLSSTTAANPTAAPSATTTYTVTVTDANATAVSSSMTITVLAAPTISTTVSNATCYGACNGSVYSNVSGGTPGYTYLWSPGGMTSPNIYSVCAGTYTLTVTDANGCSTNKISTVVQPSPIAITSSQTNASCSGSCNGSASVTVSGGTPGYTFSWSPGGQTTSSISGLCAGAYSCTVTDANGCTKTNSLSITEPALLNANITTTNISCNGACNGSALSSPTGGTGPYTFSWSPGGSTTAAISGLCSGTYTLTITDANGCTSGGGASVSEPAALVGTLTSQTNVACFGGSSGNFYAVASGGTSPYIFSIDGSVFQGSGYFTNLFAGAYTIFIKDANGCLITIPATITQPSAINISSGQTSTTCSGMCNGAAFVTASGGTLGYNFMWSPGGQTSASISGACAGTYTVTVTDANGCSQTAAVTVTEPAPIAANITALPVSCSGSCNGMMAASPTGGTGPYNFLWTPGGTSSAAITNLCPGLDTVTITDANGCMGTEYAFISSPSALLVTTSAYDTICKTASAVISAIAEGGTSPYTFMWDNGATSPVTTVSPITNTLYTVTVTDANGCIGSGSTAVIVSPNTDVVGAVTYSGGSLSSGTNKAILYKRAAFLTTFDTIQIAVLDIAGKFTFSLVDPGNYLIKVFPDTAAYPLLVPTYYGNVYLWDSALTLVHSCGLADTANVVMIETSSATGPGMISGHISQGAGYGRAPGDPVPGIDIKLGRNPGGQLFSNTVTNSNGDYSFNDVPVNAAGESYTVFVDVPGLGRDSSYTVVVTAANSQFNSLNYFIDSTTIHEVPAGTVGITNADAKENKFSVYPNPSKGNVSIEYTLLSEAKVSLCVYNVLGIKVLYLLNSRQSAGTYKFNVDAKESNLNSGIYFIRMVKDEKTSTKRLIITQ